MIVISDVSDAAPSSSKSTDDAASQSYANIPVIVIEDVDSLSDSQIGDAGATGYDATSSMNIIDLDDVSAFHSQTGVAELPSHEEHVTDWKESSVPPSAEKKNLDSCSGDTTESEEASDDVVTPQSEHVTALSDSIDVSRYLIKPSKTSDVSHEDTVAENNSAVDTRSYDAGECDAQEDVVTAIQKPTEPHTESDAEAMDLSVVLAQAHHVINDILQTSMQRDVTSLSADTEHSFTDYLHGVTADTSTLDVIDVHDVSVIHSQTDVKRVTLTRPANDTTLNNDDKVSDDDDAEDDEDDAFLTPSNSQPNLASIQQPFDRQRRYSGPLPVEQHYVISETTDDLTSLEYGQAVLKTYGVVPDSLKQQFAVRARNKAGSDGDVPVNKVDANAAGSSSGSELMAREKLYSIVSVPPLEPTATTAALSEHASDELLSSILSHEDHADRSADNSTPEKRIENIGSKLSKLQAMYDDCFSDGDQGAAAVHVNNNGNTDNQTADVALSDELSNASSLIQPTETISSCVVDAESIVHLTIPALGVRESSNEARQQAVVYPHYEQDLALPIEFEILGIDAENYIKRNLGALRRSPRHSVADDRSFDVSDVRKSSGALSAEPSHSASVECVDVGRLREDAALQQAELIEEITDVFEEGDTKNVDDGEHLECVLDTPRTASAPDEDESAHESDNLLAREAQRVIRELLQQTLSSPAPPSPNHSFSQSFDMEIDQQHVTCRVNVIGSPSKQKSSRRQRPLGSEPIRSPTAAASLRDDVMNASKCELTLSFVASSPSPLGGAGRPQLDSMYLRGDGHSMNEDATDDNSISLARSTSIQFQGRHGLCVSRTVVLYLSFTFCELRVCASSIV